MKTRQTERVSSAAFYSLSALHPNHTSLLYPSVPAYTFAMNDQRVGCGDPFLLTYQPSELRIASEFFATWLPFLSKDLCRHCTQILSDRIHSIDPDFHVDDDQRKQSGENSNPLNAMNTQSHETSDNHVENWDTNSLGSWKDEAEIYYEPFPETSKREVACDSPSLETLSPRMSWADMADAFGEETDSILSLGEVTDRAPEKPKLSRDQREQIRFTGVRRKKDFICFERVNGKLVNILEGLELHTGIFSAAEQKRIVNYVTLLQEMGIKGELKDRTFSTPQKWVRGKGRQSIQFGCCYNYATDRDGNPPGIVQSVTVDPIPDLFKVIIQRLIRWHVLPPTCVPDSCIVNIYEEGDFMPPHIDDHDFVRPFCTVSFVSECNIVFGSNLKILGPGEFDGPIPITLPVGSVLVLNGKGADIASHCVPAVPSKRISITFRRMHVSKRPIGYVPEPDLQGIQPLVYDVGKERRTNGPRPNRYMRRQNERTGIWVDAMGYANRKERYLEPRELTQNPQRSANRRSWVRRGT